LNIWMMLGLLRMGMADRAIELWKTNLTGYLKGEDDLRQRVPPFMVSNCYYGPDHRNNAYQMEFTWITGSLAWLNTVPLRDMLGVKPDYAGLRIEPCLPTAWGEVDVERSYRGAEYQIHIHKQREGSAGSMQIKVDGLKIAGDVLPILAAGQTCQVDVTLG
jgi:cellobiose phosphorylase